MLKVKTPLGGTYFKKEYRHPKCFLTVNDENGKKSEKELDDCEYIYPHKVISACKSLDEIKQKQFELLQQGKDASKLPDSLYKLNGLYNFWPYEHEDIKKLLTAEEYALMEKYKFSCYGFFCYSTDIWDKYNDDIVGLRKGGRILRGGLQLATNYMPQGDLIDIPLKKNIGYQHVTHVMSHFEGADPDLGRKGFQPELVDVAKKVSTGLVKLFSNRRSLLKKDTGAPPDITEEKQIYDWIKQQEQHETDHPLIISRKDVFIPVKEPSITSTPLNEQDVIALFNQLLAGGVIRGLKIMSTSQHEKYDGIFKFCLQKPFENHIFDKEHNPVGIEESSASKEYISVPSILEYKYSFDALLEEIEKEEKSEKQIHLVIAWEMGENWGKRYEITPLLHYDNLHHRYFHGGTHIIKNYSTADVVFPAIILSELIAYINNPDGVQDYHKEKYIDS